jgi:hypothetical protein
LFMSRVLLAFAFVAALSATTLAANVEFQLPGGSAAQTAISVPQGTPSVALELHSVDQASMIGGGTVDLSMSAGLVPIGGVVFDPAWAGFSAFDGNALLSLFNMAGSGPGDVDLADLTINTGALAPGAYTLTANGGATGTLITDPVGMPLATTATDLVITITPEPATLGLLVLGGLAALRRRFA